MMTTGSWSSAAAARSIRSCSCQHKVQFVNSRSFWGVGSSRIAHALCAMSGTGEGSSPHGQGRQLGAKRCATVSHTATSCMTCQGPLHLFYQKATSAAVLGVGGWQQIHHVPKRCRKQDCAVSGKLQWPWPGFWCRPVVELQPIRFSTCTLL